MHIPKAPYCIISAETAHAHLLMYSQVFCKAFIMHFSFLIFCSCNNHHGLMKSHLDASCSKMNRGLKNE